MNNCLVEKGEKTIQGKSSKKRYFLFLFVCVNILQGGRNTRNRALVPVYGNLKFYFIQLGPATHTTIYIRRKKTFFFKTCLSA